MLTAIILTLNEERHIARAIISLGGIAQNILIVDSGSTDQTVEIAERLGAKVIRHRWRNYASQFNWALSQLPADTKWVLRLDADEVITDRLRINIRTTLPDVSDLVDGMVMGRRMTFLGRPIKHGGLFPLKVLRIFRYGRGRCEIRWMDEHIKVRGDVLKLEGEILDDNLNTVTWWTSKHNQYASREVIDLINVDRSLFTSDDARGAGKAAVFKRFLKEQIYSRFPIGGRALTYFIYRYILRLGFLDGWEGLAFHALQGFWYRFLIDVKLSEVRTHMRNTGADPTNAIRDILGIDLNESGDENVEQVI